MKGRHDHFKEQTIEATKVFDIFLNLAPTKMRNYIWDQTNLSAPEREGKISVFRNASAKTTFAMFAEVFVVPDEVCEYVYNL